MIGLLFVLGLVVWMAYVGLSGLIDVEDPRKAMARRAEQQHRQWMAGDEQGLYGQYPPADLS